MENESVQGGEVGTNRMTVEQLSLVLTNLDGSPMNDYDLEVGDDLENCELPDFSDDDGHLFETSEWKEEMTSNRLKAGLESNPMEYRVNAAMASQGRMSSSVMKSSIKQRIAATNFCNAARSLQKEQRKVGDGIRFSEESTVTTNETYHALKVCVSDELRKIYTQKRNIEIQALYGKLGCVAHVTDENCFGSYREIAKAARLRRDEWVTNDITKWLLSIGIGENKWEGGKHPYSALLNHLPVTVQSYLDYGCGSGNGAIQVAKYLGQHKIAHCYDLENSLVDEPRRLVQFREKIDQQYQLVTLVNVLHHEPDAGKLLSKVMSTVMSGGVLIIKDHFVNSMTIGLATLVHEMYEPTGDFEEPEDMYFRDIKRVVQYFRGHGWTVELKNVPNDLSDIILICRNLRDGGKAQVMALEEKVDLLTQEVADMRLMLSQKFANPHYSTKPKPGEAKYVKRSRANRYRAVVANNDLSVPQDRVDRRVPKEPRPMKSKENKNDERRVPEMVVTTPSLRWVPKSTVRGLDEKGGMRPELAVVSNWVPDARQMPGWRPVKQVSDDHQMNQEGVVLNRVEVAMMSKLPVVKQNELIDKYSKVQAEENGRNGYSIVGNRGVGGTEGPRGNVKKPVKLKVATDVG